MRLSINRLWRQPNPIPSYKNVSPDGEGWYRFNGTKWERWPGINGNYDGAGRWLTKEQLFQFASDAAKVLKESSQ